MADVNDDFSRVCELEADLVKVRTSLLVVSSSLEAIADRYADPKVREQGVSVDDVDTLYGAVSLLDGIAAECQRAYKGEE